MPHYFVKQPNGKYAIYSTIVDDFLLFDATQQEAIDHELQSPGWWGYPGGSAGLECDLRKEFENIETTGKAWKWAKDWRGTVQNVCFYTKSMDADSIKSMIELGIMTRAEIEPIMAEALREHARLDAEEAAEVSA